MTGLPLPAAARELGVSVPTLRRWLRQGAPQAARGRRGRGHAATIDPEQVRAWRAGARSGADAGRLLAVLSADAPGLAVEAALAAIDLHSPATRTGAEHRLVRAVAGDAGRKFAHGLLQWIENRSREEPI